MRRLSMFIMALTIAAVSFGQTFTGSIKELAQCGKAKVEVDYSKASIHGMEEDDFALYETDWTKDKPEIISKIIVGMSEETDDLLLLGSKLNTPFTIKITVNRVNRDGDHISDVAIMMDGKDIASIKGVEGIGGTFGTKLNLIKDGAERTGKKIGKILRKQIKKEKKQ